MWRRCWHERDVLLAAGLLKPDHVMIPCAGNPSISHDVCVLHPTRLCFCICLCTHFSCQHISVYAEGTVPQLSYHRAVTPDYGLFMHPRACIAIAAGESDATLQ